MRSSLRLSAFESGLDWKALSLSPKDMDFAKSKAGAAREIALAFGVPPLLLGLPGDNTFANYADLDTAYATLEELVHNALYSNTIEERQALKDFMNELTSGNYDENQLREIWLKSKADVLPFWGDEGSCTEFLSYLRQLVENDEPPRGRRS